MQWSYASRLSRTTTARDPIVPLLLRSLVVKEVTADLHGEQLNAEQLRGQHPVPITPADHHHMEMQIQEALHEQIPMLMIISVSIMGCNEAARKVLGGAVLAPQTSLINGDPAALIRKSDKQKAEVQAGRNRSRESQQTFTSLEKLLVKEDKAKKVDLTGDTSQLRVWVAVDRDVTITVTAPGMGTEGNDDGIVANDRKRAGKQGGKGKGPRDRTPTRTELLGLSDILKRAEPEQGVMILSEAWGTFLLQRACLVFEGMLALHTWLTDAKVKKKSGSRLDANEWIKNGKYMRPNQPHLHSDGKRTHGIVRAIIDSVTCDRLLPPTQHRYSHLNTSSRYLAMCWPSLTQQTIDILELEKYPAKTNANVTPVNSVIKILSTAAVLGRLPTCASGAVMLTQDELDLADPAST
ncbi:hypothetical protein JKP88DRAFT_311706 [Tribonema minus]|uniref:Uncharacterized protein n=1 Tax=Tribonema minus TaxID=303371 RepID=A0A835Z5T8_9STRA|nr:hypothetical protein JKP88DRAFT_311706 [Tribonema minus]